MTQFVVRRGAGDNRKLLKRATLSSIVKAFVSRSSSALKQLPVVKSSILREWDIRLSFFKRSSGCTVTALFSTLS